MGNNRAQMILTDPPYNVRVKDIGSSGKIKHDEFAMASGEMSSDEFITFLNTFMKHAKEYSIDGSLHYLFMDWRHGIEIGLAASTVYEELKNICVWVKNNGGMGSLYRSQHELCFIYKNGKGPHTNNINLGAHGRYRTNVWEYAGANGSADGKENLKLHPTVKPVAMLKDAILDVTKRGDIVLDCFLGSGSTLIACEQTGRTCYGIEIEPKYCDVTIKRYEELTGEKAIKIGENNAYSACSVVAVMRNRTFYLLQVARARLDMTKLLESVLQAYNSVVQESGFFRIKPVLLIEDAASGTPLINLLRNLKDIYGRVLNIEAIKPKGDKIDRLYGITPYIENGQLLFPPDGVEGKERWWPDFKKELLSFPNSKYKDQVDSLTQAISYGQELLAYQ